MIYVVRAVAAARAVEVAPLVDGADAVLAARPDAALDLALRDEFARVLGDLFAFREKRCREAALPVDGRLLDGETRCEFERHELNYER